MQKLMSKSKFAALAGVNPSTVTRLALTVLLAAMFGKKVDAAHPDAIAYLEKQARSHAKPTPDGLDSLYDEAVDLCEKEQRYSISFLQKGLKVGYTRAAQIISAMNSGGLIPEKGAKPSSKPVIELVTKAEVINLKPRGQAAVKESKKQQHSPSDAMELPDDIQEFADFTLRELIEKFGTDVRFVDWLKATKSIEDISEKRLKNATTKGELVSRELVKVAIIDKIDSTFVRMLTDGTKSISIRAHSIAKAGGTVEDVQETVADLMGSFIRPAKAKILKALNNA